MLESIKLAFLSSTLGKCSLKKVSIPTVSLVLFIFLLLYKHYDMQPNKGPAHVCIAVHSGNRGTVPADRALCVSDELPSNSSVISKTILRNKALVLWSAGHRKSLYKSNVHKMA